jgi:hypothetical protein
MTYQDNGAERCFGYLMHFTGHGVYEPNFGRMEVTPEQAQNHNRLLSETEIKGVDENCVVGLGGMFYTKGENGHTIVTTWLGDSVSREVHINGQILTFIRKAMAFRARLRRDQDCFFFKRIR